MKSFVERVKAAMNDNLIVNGTQADEAIQFVLDLIEIDIDDTKVNEPYATKSIAASERAYEVVRNLRDRMEEL